MAATARPEKANGRPDSNPQDNSANIGHETQDCQQIKATGCTLPAVRLVAMEEKADIKAPLRTTTSPSRVELAPPPSLVKNSAINPHSASPSPHSLRAVSRSPGRKCGARKARKIGWV